MDPDPDCEFLNHWFRIHNLQSRITRNLNSKIGNKSIMKSNVEIIFAESLVVFIFERKSFSHKVINCTLGTVNYFMVFRQI